MLTKSLRGDERISFKQTRKIMKFYLRKKLSKQSGLPPDLENLEN